MKKKLLIGVSLIGLAAGFWACGEGTVEPLSEQDGYVKAMMETGSIDFAVQVKESKEKCALDPVCMNEAARQQGAAMIEESSETPIESSSSSLALSQTTPSSSSNLFTFSSAGPIGQVSSSSEEQIIVQSSSSADEPLPAGAFGTCGPGAATGELNSPVSWTFTWDTKSSGVGVNEIQSASYTWTFSGEGANPTTFTGTGSTGRATTVTYSKSGAKGASVDIQTSQHGKQTVNCKAVNVNGAKISGCKCVSTNIAPDVAKGQSAAWTVTGCSTAAPAQITGYTWTGATADATDVTTATATVTKKGDMVTGVSVLVENDDNTKVTVTCEDAKAVDSTMPDYLFEINGDQVSTKAIDVANEGCMTIRGNWTNSGYSPTLSVLCDGRAADQNVGMTFTMKYGTKSYQGSGSWGFSNAGGQIGQVKMGEFSFENICVTFTGAETVSCKVQ